MSNPRGRSLAFACVGAIALAGGAMYVAQKESKSTESQKSIYRSPGGLDQNDAKMDAGDVRAAMHKAPGKS